MRRHFPRFPADMPMVATVIGDRDVSALSGRCTVVSEGGLGAVLPGRIPLGDVVALELHFPNSADTVRVRATIRHSHYPNYGMEFCALGEEQRRVIARYCEICSRPARALMIDMIRRYFLAGED
ncbi:MAG TPA: PilZ domain-containing protein [Terriglobales bacterium]|jgi:c-di-GMP-binding flagellar brake protein YcgR|nr:PilZ domain-containing protein [Terriglobales bacterium]